MSDTDWGGVQGVALGDQAQVPSSSPPLPPAPLLCPAHVGIARGHQPLTVLCNQRILPETGCDPTGEARGS